MIKTASWEKYKADVTEVMLKLGLNYSEYYVNDTTRKIKPDRFNAMCRDAAQLAYQQMCSE